MNHSSSTDSTSTPGVESAILLVGGFGTRLAPLTHKTPKPMLKVAGIPFTEHQIVKAREAGIKEIVLATSYLAEVFEPYFGDGEQWGIEIRYAVEEVALGTGGAIRNAASMITRGGPVVIFNGDVLSSHSLRGHFDFHQSRSADVSLYLTEVSDARAFGAVELEGDAIRTFNEKMENPPTNIINAGCYIFNREFIDAIPADRVVSVERETFPGFLRDGASLYGYVDRSYWLDIGTPAALQKATRDLISGAAQSDAYEHLLRSGSHELRADSLIATSAQIATGADIRSGNYIGADVIVHSGAELSGCIVLDGAIISASTKLDSSFVAEKCTVPAATIATGNFLGF